MKSDLFGENEKQKNNNFKINKEFEERYNYNKKREHINKLKDKFSPEDINEEISSSSIDENFVLGQKEDIEDFLVTYAKVKRHDPEIYDSKKKFFRNEKTQLIKKEAKEKKYTIKD